LSTGTKDQTPRYGRSPLAQRACYPAGWNWCYRLIASLQVPWIWDDAVLCRRLLQGLSVA